ncbi:hypothetical protein SAMN05421856_102420 [Chryseobacterium taichungense]|uniref:Uncharacterized protein n=1 Tax=Chryseobacterium taichungense TaxID=295069 RepID=A0A1H7XFZ5_9FLAO|nr:peptidylprolyl isomerase [Chryseobacterium taichungense]SEM32706.1 hypothetical protein SAMN05421856_102420 [Chryseobacterium taichungense]
MTDPNIDWWPNAAGSHFFLTDAGGNSATIALLNGKYTVSNQSGHADAPPLQ